MEFIPRPGDLRPLEPRTSSDRYYHRIFRIVTSIGLCCKIDPATSFVDMRNVDDEKVEGVRLDLGGTAEHHSTL